MGRRQWNSLSTQCSAAALVLLSSAHAERPGRGPGGGSPLRNGKWWSTAVGPRQGRRGPVSGPTQESLKNARHATGQIGPGRAEARGVGH